MHWQEAVAKSRRHIAIRWSTNPKCKIERRADGLAFMLVLRPPYEILLSPEKVEGFTDWEPLE